MDKKVISYIPTSNKIFNLGDYYSRDELLSLISRGHLILVGDSQRIPVISKSVTFGVNNTVSSDAIIIGRITIGNNNVIYANTTIVGDEIRIGDNNQLGWAKNETYGVDIIGNITIGDHTILGDRSEIISIGLSRKIGDYVRILGCSRVINQSCARGTQVLKKDVYDFPPLSSSHGMPYSWKFADERSMVVKGPKEFEKGADSLPVTRSITIPDFYTIDLSHGVGLTIYSDSQESIKFSLGVHFHTQEGRFYEQESLGKNVQTERYSEGMKLNTSYTTVISSTTDIGHHIDRYVEYLRKKDIPVQQDRKEAPSIIEIHDEDIIIVNPTADVYIIYLRDNDTAILRFKK